MRTKRCAGKRGEDVFYYPDVMVDCSPASDADRTVRAPCVVVEVTSPSTSTIDQREKLAAYRKIDSVRAYLIVEQSRRRVEHHWRDATGAWWREELVDEQQVPIPCLDVRLTLDEIYGGVRLATTHGLTQRQLAAIRRIIILHRDRIMEAWREHCGATE